jgi:hypothetical protein
MTGKNMTIEHKDFLNALRDSGVTNMFGAASYLQREFGITSQKAKTILLEWMMSFNDR